MDTNTALERALQSTGKVVASITPDQYDLPTPCSEYDVKALLAHTIGANLMFAEVARQKKFVPPEGPMPDVVGSDPASSFEQAAQQAAEAWRAPGILDEMVELPFATLPGQVAAGILTTENVVHGWDLARATGQSIDIDPELAELCFAGAQMVSDEFRGSPGSGKAFGPKVDVPDSAPITDRLLGHLGRQP